MLTEDGHGLFSDYAEILRNAITSGMWMLPLFYADDILHLCGEFAISNTPSFDIAFMRIA